MQSCAHNKYQRPPGGASCRHGNVPVTSRSGLQQSRIYIFRRVSPMQVTGPSQLLIGCCRQVAHGTPFSLRTALAAASLLQIAATAAATNTSLRRQRKHRR